MSKEYFTEVAEKVVADRFVVDEGLIRDLAFSFSNMYSTGYNTAKNNRERREPYAELKEYKLPISAKSRSLIERVTAGNLLKSGLKDNGKLKKQVKSSGDTYIHLKCGEETIINHVSIIETHIQEPYKGYFCHNCNDYHPLNEFVWNGTDEEAKS